MGCSPGSCCALCIFVDECAKIEDLIGIVGGRKPSTEKIASVVLVISEEVYFEVLGRGGEDLIIAAVWPSTDQRLKIRHPHYYYMMSTRMGSQAQRSPLG